MANAEPDLGPSRAWFGTLSEREEYLGREYAEFRARVAALLRGMAKAEGCAACGGYPRCAGALEFARVLAEAEA